MGGQWGFTGRLGVQPVGRAQTLKEGTKENNKMLDKWAPPRQDMAGSCDT